MFCSEAALSWLTMDALVLCTVAFMGLIIRDCAFFGWWIAIRRVKILLARYHDVHSSLV